MRVFAILRVRGGASDPPLIWAPTALPILHHIHTLYLGSARAQLEEETRPWNAGSGDERGCGGEQLLTIGTMPKLPQIIPQNVDTFVNIRGRLLLKWTYIP